ncbi:hypothetical protein [Planctomicrobium piriforme]|uniref:Uncharacterized protein n=1 Tax=Planctomicrobium piriforme TaxID=1576369 RepID=A0A1I3FBI8_9PLAN|nr:hypothetical protein [Planctomicrobium piriforme]SFI08603.1 hypothetical protein SAMN05421753_105166 [Planctomicrobium piriforme]
MAQYFTCVVSQRQTSITNQFVTCLIGIIAWIPLAAFADEMAIERHVDELLRVVSPDVGYSTWFSGSGFLPYPESEQLGTFIIGATQRSSSDALKKIVEQGAASVPVLLKHIDDPRKINLPEMTAGGIVWMAFPDEYDFNEVTRPQPPRDVNRGSFLETPGQHPNSHSLTIGDLCFVALGQIVNRKFSATRYQPTGGIIVNSPTYSERLRTAIIADWEGLTVEKHKQSLIDDFRHPDYASRREGAYLRLSFYYPNTVEELVVEEFSKPTYDAAVVADFCQDMLYKSNSANERQSLYEQFIKEHGEVYASGVEDQLFEDLYYLEATEEKRVNPPLTAFSNQPRELLIQLFHKPTTIRSDQRPFVQTAEQLERSNLIRTLIHDDSKKIGDLVKQLYLKSPDDDYVAPDCLRCLANRGYGEFLVEQLEKIELSNHETNSLHSSYIDAVSISRDTLVREKLYQIALNTVNEDYFMFALPAFERDQDEVVLQTARKLLAGLPAETDRGLALLTMIRDRFPKEAKDVFVSFLEPKTTGRIETMCRVLWYGHPLGSEVLSPFLEDERELHGFIKPIRVRNRVREALRNGESEK